MIRPEQELVQERRNPWHLLLLQVLGPQLWLAEGLQERSLSLPSPSLPVPLDQDSPLQILKLLH
jgi:hypothetical protein